MIPEAKFKLIREYYSFQRDPAALLMIILPNFSNHLKKTVYSSSSFGREVRETDEVVDNFALFLKIDPIIYLNLIKTTRDNKNQIQSVDRSCEASFFQYVYFQSCKKWSFRLLSSYRPIMLPILVLK